MVLECGTRPICDITADQSILMDSQWFKYRRHTAEGPDRTVLRVLVLADASVRSGSLVVVLRQSQGPDARARRRLAAGGLRLL